VVAPALSVGGDGTTIARGGVVTAPVLLASVV
jgi:hypothetical protein